MALLYIDTNIFLDAIEARENRAGKNIGKYALELIQDALSCKHHIIISAFTLYELQKFYSGDLTLFFSLLKKKTLRVDVQISDKKAARALSSTNFDDALHIILAQKSAADYIVTRNIGDFLPLSNIVVKRPEDLL